MRDPNFRWDDHWLEMAAVVAKASKDPSSRVGAVLVDEKNRVVSVGYNGFPRGCSDDENIYKDRNRKLMRVLHAEENAVLFAERKAYTSYVTHPPCAHCTAVLIQFGIKRIIYKDIEMNESWKSSIEEAKIMCAEADVDYIAYERE